MNLDARVKKCGWLDIGLIKLSVFAFTLLVAKLWSPILSLDWYWYAIIAVLAALKPAVKVLRK